jgi:hypothetical protein
MFEAHMRVRYAPNSGYIAAWRQVKRRATTRRPRCKKGPGKLAPGQMQTGLPGARSSKRAGSAVELRPAPKARNAAHPQERPARLVLLCSWPHKRTQRRRRLLDRVRHALVAAVLWLEQHISKRSLG